MPLVPDLQLMVAQMADEFGPEPDALGADRLIRNLVAAGGHEQLDLPERKRDPVIQPYAVVDDLACKSVSLLHRQHRSRDSPTVPPCGTLGFDFA